MNKKTVVFAVLVAVLLFVAGCSRSEPEAKNDDVEAFETIYSGSVDAGDVSVALTPVGVSDGKLVVDVSVNTHSVSLEQFDLANITTLEYTGKSLVPSSAPLLRGHHNSGQLVFDVGEPLSGFRITIRDIPKVDERVFEWT